MVSITTCFHIGPCWFQIELNWFQQSWIWFETELALNRTWLFGFYLRSITFGRKLTSLIMTSLILWLLLSGATAPLSNNHKINDVIMTSGSYHVASNNSSLSPKPIFIGSSRIRRMHETPWNLVYSSSKSSQPNTVGFPILVMIFYISAQM